ncbi:hypothetical protein [Deinococcus sp. ME38]|uniref:hypothetical protein n=1 Tax=Deinococcus sp. ME38 TaxID=3400344 RepID=UPI003B5BA2C9
MTKMVLRTPDGRSLPRPASTLRVQAPDAFAPDPPGGLCAHPALLRGVLDTLAARLDAMMDRAEQDETLSVEAQSDLIRAVGLGQALVTGLEGYAAAPDRTLLERLSDLAQTLALLQPDEARLSGRVAAIAGAAGHAWLEGVPLLPDEDAPMITLTLDAAQAAGIRVGERGEARLTWAGVRRPAPLRDPLTPLRAALTPPATLDAGRHGTGQALQRLALGEREGERNAALLLLFVCGRDRLEDLPLILALDRALVLLRALHAQEPTPATTHLLELHAALHAELGRPDLPLAQRERRQASGDLGGQVLAARRTLRALRFGRLRPVTPETQEHLNVLWDALNDLDEDLSRGVTPDRDSDLRARLLLLSLQGLTSTARAPGLRLPPMVQLAAQVSGVDPLWAWERTQPERFTSGPLHGHLGRAALPLELLALRGTPFWDTWGTEVRRLTALAGGNLLASVRRAGLRLPDQAFLEGYLGGFGPLRALPMDPAALNAFHAALLRLLPDAHAQAQALAVPAEAPASPPPVPRQKAPTPPLSGPPPPGPATGSPPVPATQDAPEWPAHVLGVREHLRGRRMVLLGGVPSAPHHAALLAAFELSELDWIGSAEYAHGTHAQAHVTPDTAVVILAIRWMAHAHNTLRDVARARGVPYVMHPGGLSPSSVAWQIGRQVSQQLGQQAGQDAGPALPDNTGD